MIELVVAALIAIIASAAQALTGFGFALVLVPLLGLLFAPKTVVMISLSLGLVCKLPLLVHSWRQVEVARIAPLCVAAILGSVVGTQALIHTDPKTLRLGIGIVVVALGIPLLLDRRWPVRREGLAALGVGLLSGALNGATSMGGPPVVLLGANQSWSKESFRANLTAFFVVSNVASLGLLVAAGAFPVGVLILDLELAPGVALGLVAGNVLFGRLPVAAFRRLVVLLVIVMGCVSIWTGLRA